MNYLTEISIKLISIEKQMTYCEILRNTTRK